MGFSKAAVPTGADFDELGDDCQPEARTTADAVASAHKPDRKTAFNHARHAWLGRVARDHKLSGASHRVAVIMWQHQNAKRGCAWCSIAYMARELRMHRSTVIRSVRSLERRGWLNVRTRLGPHRTNEYRPAFGSNDEGE